MEKTLGSLFDGIGGFPLAGSRHGIKALWASEIEPFPIKVTKVRFPDMKHLGDVTKIDGTSIASVDIITFGSPCQDLSIAGKRAGLAGERSGLFMEAIRIIKEMRSIYERTSEPIRPRFAVWENVPGAFSSNKGEDFRAVLEEVCRIKDGSLSISEPPKGKWNKCGCIMGDGFSVAWRTLDAQFWGVPQRRRRIFLVADFGGNTAPEILFKRKGLSRYSQEGRKAGQGIATDAERGFRETGPGYWGEGIGCLRAEGENRPSRPSNVVVAIDSNCQDSRFKLTGQVVPTIPAKSGTGGNNGPMLAIPINDQATHTNGCSNGSMVGNLGEPMYSLTAQDKHSVAVLPFDTTQITSPQNGNNPKYGDPCHPLAAGAHPPAAVINCQPSGISGTVSSKWAKGTGGPAGDEHYNLVIDETARPLSAQPQMRHRLDMDNVVMTVAGCDFRNDKENGDLCGTLQAKPGGGQSLNCIHPVRIGYSVRRLTPLECERLQGYPDGWTDIEGASDSGRYKALGNSVAIPCVEFVLEGISEVLDREQRS